ncbi:MAG: DNA gyrase subunit A [Magnetococcales bacterium]|nr:DNA gyrase subunit A [Magnetococcales bacterium]
MTERSTLPQKHVTIEDEMQRAYLDYAMSVIVGRALPDVRDGLKPVHRRVLFAMHELGNEWNKPYKKSARVVGDVIGKYHPHGDTAVYDTIVRMAQDFSMRHLLVDGQGNFGSVDGDSPAAMRYTEVRMTKLSHELLADIAKETVDFGPNYDGSLTEPLVLPCKFPHLLINGSSGIAVGMATNIPPHNLGEVIDATCALIDNPLLENRELMTFVPGPDFPTGGIIQGRGGIISGYETGRGSVVVRARTFIETHKKTGRESIIVHELPYQVNKARLMERIAGLVREKRITGIADMRDESDREGMRMVMDLKRDANSDVVLNQLFKHTPMQSSFGINALALVNGRPEVLALKRFLEEFIRHRREVVTRRTLFDLRKAEARAHILEGLAVALANIDRVIALIRAAPSPAVAKEKLCETIWERGEVQAMLERALPEGDAITSPQFVEDGYQLSPIQAQAILEMRLHRLTGLEQDKIHDEFGEILKEIGRLLRILGSDAVLLEVIKTELVTIKEQFANPRRTEIQENVADFSIADLIPRQEMVVTVSQRGYVKRQPQDDYRSQRRGGKGKSATGMRDEDIITQLFISSSHDTVLCFTDKGRVFRLWVYEIPQASRIAKGTAIVNLLQLEDGETVRQVLPLPYPKDEWDNWDLLFATRSGLIKKSALSAYLNIRTSGIRAIKLLDGDDLIEVALLPAITDAKPEEIEPTEDASIEGEINREEITEEVESGDAKTADPGRIMLFAKGGKAVRFRSRQVRRAGRVSQGVRGMRLKGDDEVIAMNVLEPGSGGQVLTITENGYGKRTEQTLFPTKGRGTQGVIGMITSERNGSVVGSLTVWPGDHIMLITNQGMMLRTEVETIRQTGRSTQGVTVFKVRSGEQVVSVARIAETEEEEEDIELLEGEEAGSDDLSDDDTGTDDGSDDDLADGDETPEVEE